MEVTYFFNMLAVITLTILIALMRNLQIAATSDAEADDHFNLEFKIRTDFALSHEDNLTDLYVHLDEFIGKNGLVNADGDLLTELGICMRFKLEVLLAQSFLESGNELAFYMEKADSGIAMLILQDIYYMIRLPSDEIAPFQWNHICISVTDLDGVKKLSVVMNGKMLPRKNDTLTLDGGLSISQLNTNGLNIGFMETYKTDNAIRENLFHGEMADLNIWGQSLTIEDMLATTGKEYADLGKGDVFDWSSLRSRFNETNQVYIKNLTERVFSKNRSGSIPRVYPVAASFEVGNRYCSSLGGHMALPKSETEAKTLVENVYNPKLTSITLLSSTCNSVAWIGIRKAETVINITHEVFVHDDILVDLEGREIGYVPMARGQPNGEELQKCIAINLPPDLDQRGLYFDELCDALFCTLCEIDFWETKFILRGPLPPSYPEGVGFPIDRMYTNNKVNPSTGMYGFAGFTHTIIMWLKRAGQWYVYNNYVGIVGARIGWLESSQPGGGNSDHPLGKKVWTFKNNSNGTQEFPLVFTRCDPIREFTCHLYGECVQRSTRCNGRYDCSENDFSDEEECEKVYINKLAYQKSQPPRGHSGAPIRVAVSIVLAKIVEVKELEQQISLRMKLTMTWYDSRLEFKNLRAKAQRNLVGHDQVQEIWTPRLVFSNSVDGDITVMDEASYLTVIKRGNGTPNTLDDPHEDLMYSGAENPMQLTRLYTVKLICPFQLNMFPFDLQKCPLSLNIPYNLQTGVDLALDDISTYLDQGFNLTQYDFTGFEFDDVNLSPPKGNTKITMWIRLRRIFTYHLGTTFLPTLCLIFIAELTLCIDERHFEATIMVALTSMLVMYTLYQSVSNSLPQTAYLKMIDYWLLFGLVVPFFIILILMGMDAYPPFLQTHNNTMINKLQNEIMVPVAEARAGRTCWVRKLLKMSKYIVSLATFLFVALYWTIALAHFSSNF